MKQGVPAFQYEEEKTQGNRILTLAVPETWSPVEAGFQTRPLRGEPRVMPKLIPIRMRLPWEKTSTGMTALSGLPAYLELAHASGMRSSVERHAGSSGGWSGLDRQPDAHVADTAGLAGGEPVVDLDVLEKDQRFCRIQQGRGSVAQNRGRSAADYPSGRAALDRSETRRSPRSTSNPAGDALR